MYARDHGALVPARQVSSAKSWLSNPSVDRTAPLLPWLNEEGRRISPVEASARLLAHLRDAWNHEHAGDDETLRLERLPIVLTVPASFDEEARELTVQAARDAGFEQLTLLEEPLAALYAWIAAHRRDLSATLGDGALVLVCDVGGGTTDFSLIRTAIEDGELVFERIAIGEHLLLGGDNLDLALAVLVEQKIAGGAAKLTLTQRQTLRRKCSAAKEQLLSEPDLGTVRITILGGGRGVVGGGVTAELTRDDVVRALEDGFLPLTAADDLPARNRRVGLRELGLPYESEPAITKHLAGFLSRAMRTDIRPDEMASDSRAKPGRHGSGLETSDSRIPDPGSGSRPAKPPVAWHAPMRCSSTAASSHPRLHVSACSTRSRRGAAGGRWSSRAIGRKPRSRSAPRSTRSCGATPRRRGGC